ncbi:MAG: hypothetical protein JXI43_10335 [Tissierellales bacterium]|nr:hypothetical protein [Tissierellales bacterium]
MEQLKKHNAKSFNIGNKISKLTSNNVVDSLLFDIPILGYANCGKATVIADEDTLGFLTVSTSLVKKKNNLFALIASGDSMNKANINGSTIEDGDFVVVDGDKRSPINGDYVVSIIEDCANIKRYYFDKKNEQIVLISESKTNYPPIVIHPSDFSEYMVNGIITNIVKKLSIKI